MRVKETPKLFGKSGLCNGVVLWPYIHFLLLYKTHTPTRNQGRSRAGGFITTFFCSRPPGGPDPVAETNSCLFPWRWRGGKRWNRGDPSKNSSLRRSRLQTDGRRREHGGEPDAVERRAGNSEVQSAVTYPSVPAPQCSSSDGRRARCESSASFCVSWYAVSVKCWKYQT